MNNPSAFPIPFETHHDGMTLRDYFAAKAMQALLTNPECQLEALDEVPQASYKMADAMMKERES
jgi:hypothetical protein